MPTKWGQHWGVLQPTTNWQQQQQPKWNQPEGPHQPAQPTVHKYWATQPTNQHNKFQQSTQRFTLDNQPQIRSSTECWTTQFLVGRLHARCCANNRAWVRQWRKLLQPQLLSSDKVVDNQLRATRTDHNRCRRGQDSQLNHSCSC